MRVSEAVSRVVRFPLQVGGGGIAGSYYGLKSGLPAALAEVPTEELSNVYQMVRNWLKSFVGGGCKDLAPLLEDYAGRKGFGEIFEKIIGGSVGVKGLGMLGIYGVAAATALYWGINLAKSSWSTVGQLNKGYRPDVVKNPWIHGAQAISGLTMAGGVAMLFHPATFALAVPTALAGFAGSLVTHGVRYAIGGKHWFRYDEAAPWPLNILFRKFRNDNINYYG